MTFSRTNVYSAIHDNVVRTWGTKAFTEKHRTMTLFLTGRNEIPPYLLNKPKASTSGRNQQDLGCCFEHLKSMLTFFYSA